MKIFLPLMLALPLSATAADDALLDYLDQSADQYAEMAHDIWEYAEMGYLETRSSARLSDALAAEGFSIEKGVADIPTAFVATYGSGEPVIAILAEMDALPGISQSAAPQREVRDDVSSGHACGHHLFGAGSVAAAVAVKRWMEQNNVKGTLRVLGTPAEEGGSGKVYLVRAGLFDDVDVALHWHPSDANDANAASSLANKSAKFRFRGVASHAAVAPQHGRSALDGVEAMNMMVNMLREHVPQETRIHYVITSGGSAPNVVPEFAEVFYYVRHPNAGTLAQLWERVIATAEGAALGTGTQMNYEVIHGNHSLLPNEALARAMHANLTQVGGVQYSADERAYAKKISATLGNAAKPLESAEEILPFELEQGMGSTDVGDVSWTVPTVGLGTATWVPGTSAHTWQAIAAGGMSIGHKGMMVAARTLALSMAELFEDAELRQQAKDEFEQRRGEDFKYRALLGDREPPLDYRVEN